MISIPSVINWLSVKRILEEIVQNAANNLVPVGSGMKWPSTSDPTDTKWMIEDGRVLKRAEYPEMFAWCGTQFGDGYGDNLTFNIPDSRGVVHRGYQSTATVTGTGTVGTNNTATFTNHGFNRTGIKVRFSTGTLTGLSANTTYWAIVVDANTLAFATSHLLASLNTRVTISGSNSAVLFMYEDPDSATRTYSGKGGVLAGVGSRQDDQFQGHYHNFSGSFNSTDGAATPANYVQATAATTATRDLSAREYVNTPRADGINGTPRYGVETRMSNMSTNWIIKVRS